MFSAFSCSCFPTIGTAYSRDWHGFHDFPCWAQMTRFQGYFELTFFSSTDITKLSKERSSLEDLKNAAVPVKCVCRDWGQSGAWRTRAMWQGPTLVPATSPTNSNQFEFVGLVAGIKFWSPRLDHGFCGKNGQFSRCDKSLRLVAGTSRRD